MIDVGIVGYHPGKLKPQALNFLERGLFEPVGHAVDDKRQPPYVEFEFFGEILDAPGGLNSPHRGVGHREHQVHVVGSATREVLHSGFVVEHHVFVGVGYFVDVFFAEGVGVAVAARAFGATHADKIVAVGFDQAFLSFVVDVCVFGHTGRDTRSEALPDFADGLVNFSTKYFIEVEVRVGVDCEDAPFVALRLKEAEFAPAKKGGP